MIVRPLTQDFDWDQYVDLTNRAFGPVDEAMVQPSIELVVAAGRCLAAFDGDRMAATALYHDLRQWWHGRAVPMAGCTIASSDGPNDRMVRSMYWSQSKSGVSGRTITSAVSRASP